MPLVLIRHTRVDAPAGICYGRHEVPLAPSFDAEAGEVWSQLPWPPDVVWTSPSERCRKLAERLGGEVRVDDRLRELHFGEWEGRSWESFRGPESEAWALDPWGQRPPGGESGEELWKRVGQVRAELEAAGSAGHVAVVTHAGAIRAWRAQAEGRAWAELLAEPIGFGSVHLLG